MTKAIALGLMTAFIGTKTVLATPMSREDYDNYRGLPVTPLAESDGYMVEYMDGGKSNHPNHEGFISWSPKSVFENAYRQNGSLTFGDAIYALKQGKKVNEIAGPALLLPAAVAISLIRALAPYSSRRHSPP